MLGTEQVRNRAETPSNVYRGVWAVLLLAGTLLWAGMWHIAIDGSDTLKLPAMTRFATALGMASPIYFGTALIALVVWFATKKPNAAMWTRTVTLLVGIAFLGVGAARISSQPGSTATASRECLTPDDRTHVGVLTMTSGMGGIKRCLRCYTRETNLKLIKQLDSVNIPNDFKAALAAVVQSKREYIDRIARPLAASSAATLSTDCEACRKTASAIEAFSLAPDLLETAYQAQQVGCPEITDI